MKSNFQKVKSIIHQQMGLILIALNRAQKEDLTSPELQTAFISACDESLMLAIANARTFPLTEKLFVDKFKYEIIRTIILIAQTKLLTEHFTDLNSLYLLKDSVIRQLSQICKPLDY